MSPASVTAVVERVYRAHAGRLLAVLTRQLGPGCLALAEDSAQEALLAALDHWPRTGVPDNPPAWLLQVARRKALDALRRDQLAASRGSAVEFELARSGSDDPIGAFDLTDEPLADDQLRFVFLCCHPALAPGSRVALTLRLAGGFTVLEIARAFLSDETAVAQRLVRAKRTLREVDAPFEIPPSAELPARLDAVLDVLYLTFNEGYAASEGEALLRRDLSNEAIRLAELLLSNPQTAEPRVHALLAIFCFHAARFETRTDAAGALVRLAEQDRTRWDKALIARGLLHLEQSAQGQEESAYHIEAEIASCHTVAPSWRATDWPRILGAYDRLLALTRSPVVGLNRAVVVREVRGPAAALEELSALSGAERLTGYPPYHAVRGELLAASGQDAAAAAAFRTALDLARSAPFKALAQRRVDALEAPDVDSSTLRSSLA